jgi:uncharacterized protein (PEP-CTERM system associated)
MAAGLAALQLPGRRVGLAAVAWCIQMSTAAAFPVTDQITPTVLPQGADLAAPDVMDLQHQMGLASGFAGLGLEGGWVILPRITAEETLTDNVFEARSPRQWDLTTIISPGVAVLGDTTHLQLRLNYAPELEMHVEAGDQNVLAQQLNAVGTVTIIPDALFVDLRALAGVQATNGGIGGQGGLGQPGSAPVTASTIATPGQEGLAKGNRSQTAIISISPYVLHQWSDVGTVKFGVSASQTSTSVVTGFAPIPLVSQGTDYQHQSTLEEFGEFQTGDELVAFRDTVSADARQSSSGGTGTGYSSRETANNRLDYQINRTVSVYGEIGWEDINYGGGTALHINGPTWGVGTTLTPNPDSALTLGYGFQNGAYTFLFQGRYALTARTILTGTYNNGIGTQLEQLNDALDQAAVSDNGALLNSQTGGPLFVGNNALGVAAGVYRIKSLTLSLATTLDSDQFTVVVGHTEQTQLGRNATAGSNGVWTGTAAWTHQISPDLVGTATASYSLGSPLAGEHSNSLVASVGLQYILSETVSTFARYTFYDRQSSIAGDSFYQDLFLVGIVKQF